MLCNDTNIWVIKFHYFLIFSVYIQDVLDLCSTSCICDVGVLAKLSKQPSSSPPASYDIQDSRSKHSHSVSDPVSTQRPCTTSSQQEQISSESSHTFPSHSYPDPQLPQTDHSASVNITLINVDSDLREQPIRLFVNHAERQPQIRNGHSGEEGHLGSSGSSVQKNQMSDANSGSGTDHCDVNPLYLNSSSEDNLKTSPSSISGQLAFMDRQVHSSSKPHIVNTDLCSQVQESASVAKETGLPRNESETDSSVKVNVGQASAKMLTPDMCPECENWRSVLIMVPVRLGGESLNPIYHPCIYSLFTHDLSVGIIGGRPKHSLYFVGFQGKVIL